MSSGTKDTIYIDIDDEITSIIEKVKSSPHKIVALVLPKRATMLQSIVNMKLLQRSADEAKKNLVLITSETGLMPLAGAVGLHVAKTLQSKPEVPPPPASSEEAEAEPADGEDSDLDDSKSVGELAGMPDEEETIEVDTPDEEASVTAETKPKKKKKDRKLKIPNFNKFRTRLFLGIGALVALIFLWYLTSYVFPHARITIKTDTSNINSEIQFTARPGLEEADLEKGLLPGAKEEVRKTDTEKAPATGQKDVGKKASGDITFSIACADVDSFPETIPAGTGVSTGGLTFITQSTVVLDNPGGGGGCSFRGSGSVVAQNGGEQYNIGPATYSVSGHGDISGSGGSMSGGTSKVIKVVRQEDIDGAKNRLIERNNEDAKEELTQKLSEAGYLPLDESFKAGKPTVASSPNVGDEATEVTITSTVVYTMNGVKQDALEELISEDVKDNIDTSKQQILDYGLGEAAFRLVKLESNDDARMSLGTLVVAGPHIDEAELKKEIMGKKKGETIQIIQNRPGIREVDIKYSPFWVFSTPKKEGKITFVFENAGETTNSDDSEQQ